MECDILWARASPELKVSIHALLVECDHLHEDEESVRIEFQSTHSLWSATDFMVDQSLTYMVSIHALLVECDVTRPEETKQP